MTKAIIFDLDGTLLNTLDSIAYYANHTLGGVFFSELIPESSKHFLYRQFFGNNIYLNQHDKNCPTNESPPMVS